MSSYRFGRFDLDLRTRLLKIDGRELPLGPKVVETLAALVARPGELVTKAELMDAVWPGKFVEEGNLTQNVFRLRRALADGGLTDAIQTMPGRGYRFVPPARRKSTRPWAGAIVLAVAALCIPMVLPGSHANGARLDASSQAAYRLALYHLNFRTDTDHARRALTYFHDLTIREPHSAVGYAGMADASIALFDAVCESDVHRCPGTARLAMENARRAVAVDPASVEARTALAMALYVFDAGDALAESEFRTAIAMDPNYALAHHWYGNFLTVRGRFQEALREHRIAMNLDPTSPATYAWLAEDAFFSERYADAIAYGTQAANLWPLRHPTLLLLGLAYEHDGNLRQAKRYFARLGPLEARALTAGLLARHGQRQRAKSLLRGIEPEYAASHDAGVAMAFAWLAAGDPDRAQEFMRRVVFSNRIERNFLARDPRWRWAKTAAPWITPV